MNHVMQIRLAQQPSDASNYISHQHQGVGLLETVGACSVDQAWLNGDPRGGGNLCIPDAEIEGGKMPLFGVGGVCHYLGWSVFMMNFGIWGSGFGWLMHFGSSFLKMEEFGSCQARRL